MTTVNVQYGKLDQPVSFRGCSNLVDLLGSISNGVPIHQTKALEPQVPQIVISRVDSGYCRESAWLSDSAVFHDPVDAIGDLTVDLFHALVQANPKSLCLHCAAVEFSDGLYIFPMTYRTGKSLMSTYLSTIGAKLYTDDALLVSPKGNTGMATGLYPRLRLPLPDHIDRRFTNFVKSRSVLHNNRYCYVGLQPDQMVPFGTTAPIKGAILLYRETVEKPQLEPIGRKEAIKEIILRNFARNNSAVDIVDRVAAIVDNGQCYKLNYQHIPVAARLLINKFGAIN